MDVDLTNFPIRLGADEAKRGRLKLTREDQSIRDSGVVKTRAELSRHLGVSGTKITQVLMGLDE